MLRLALLALAVFATGCRTTDSGSETKTVFGTDNRVDWDTASNDEFPFHSVGKLSSGCTASQVGTQLIITAAHCVWQKDSSGLIPFLTYTPYYRNQAGQTFGVTVLDKGSSQFWTGQNYDDWAILLLDTPTFEQPFRVAPTSWINPVGRKTWVAGFSQDVVGLAVDSQCSTKSTAGGVIFHDCDIKPGASGGPIWIKDDNGERFIIGVQSGEHSDNDGQQWTMETSNTGCSSDMFIDRLKLRLTQYP